MLLTGFCFLVTYYSAFTQTTYLQLGHVDYELLDRLETKSGKLSNLSLSTKPVSRKSAVAFLEDVWMQRDISLSSIDSYNIRHMISVSSEWAETLPGPFASKNILFNRFYRTQPDFFSVNEEQLFLTVNPVISAVGIYEKINSDSRLFTSSRGIEARGRLANRIGFYTFFTDNQEQVPLHIGQWRDSFNAVPGADFHKIIGKNSYDYLMARSHVSFAIVKEHMNITFGYDKHFIGDGMRSLFLSDFSAGATFLRLNTNLWKLNYQNLYLELIPQYTRGADTKLPRKYATIHHFSINAFDWLNVGVFEAVVFDKKNKYELGYLNPIILYRQVENIIGSPDNVLFGLNFKAIALKHVQLYGQFLLDEFTFGGGTNRSHWANKFGVQFGGKYFDALTVKNLDLQGEINLVRPYTYSHFDSIANYTHYNQPLAHPLGAGFMELLGNIRYQPIKNLYLTAKAMYYQQGTDTGGANLGGNIFRDYDSRAENYGVTTINGVRAQCTLASIAITYELRENFFVDAGVTYRRKTYDTYLFPAVSTTYFTAGMRLNIAPRDYDFL